MLMNGKDTIRITDKMKQTKSGLEGSLFVFLCSCRNPLADSINQIGVNENKVAKSFNT